MNPNEEAYIVICRCILDDKEAFFLELGHNREKKEYYILGFKTEKDGIDAFENEYIKFHARGYEASISMCINWITFQPSIVKSPGLKEIERMAGVKATPTRLGNISGSFTGIRLPEDDGRTLWQKGRKPSLIEEEKFSKALNEKEITKRSDRYET